MKCPKCIEEGKKSCLYQGMSMSTCMGFNTYYDEDGKYVNNDPNTTTTHYSCSNGHKFYVKTGGYRKEPEIIFP